MGKPVARMTDMHVCPKKTGKIPHVGGPIATGSPDVLIGGLPAARVGDTVACVGPPDKIATGSSAVFINDPPLERVLMIPFEAAAQTVVDAVNTVMAEGLNAAAAGGAILDAVAGKVGKVLPLDKIKDTIKHSRSSSEALGKAGMEQAKKRLGLTTDSQYTDRYHGPDDLARDGQGRLTEIEAKGNNNSSFGVQNQQESARNELNTFDIPLKMPHKVERGESTTTCIYH